MTPSTSLRSPLAVALLLGAVSTHDVDDASRATAGQLTNSGVAAYEAGRYEAAIEKLTAAYESARVCEGTSHRDRVDSNNTLRTLSTAGSVVEGSDAAAGAALVLTAPRSEESGHSFWLTPANPTLVRRL